MDALIELGRKPALFVFNRFTCLFSLSWGATWCVVVFRNGALLIWLVEFDDCKLERLVKYSIRFFWISMRSCLAFNNLCISFCSLRNSSSTLINLLIKKQINN
jgi:hypothetical protein